MPSQVTYLFVIKVKQTLTDIIAHPAELAYNEII